MRATKLGIEANKAELNALLAFTGDDMKYATVYLRVNGAGKLIASATDGKRAVEVTATAEPGAERGEWTFDRTFIESIRRVLDAGETIAVIEVNQKGASKAVIKGIESGDRRTEIKCPTGHVSTQITMDNIHDVLGKTEANGSWFAINALYLSDIQAVAKAADKCPVSLFPGQTPDAPLTFEARSAEGAWRGVVMPVTVIGPGDQAEDEPAEEPPPGMPRPTAPLRLEPQLATEKKRKAKATKKTKGGRKAKAN
jgi:hypothetical protein